MSNTCNSCGCTESLASTTTPASGTVLSAVRYRIQNMDCPTEEALIRDKLGQVPGVTDLQFNLVQRTLTVHHDLPELTPVEAALAAIGMQATPLDTVSSEIDTQLRIAKMDCPTEEGLIRGKLGGMPGVASLAFNLVQRTLTVRHTAEALPDVLTGLKSLGFEAEVVSWLEGPTWLVVAMALIAIGTGGLSTYKKGWIALKNRNLNMNALMSIAVTGAMLIGHWPEAAMVMVLFALAEVIEA